MKVRSGFISNSSSSSFVVAFLKVPKSREELQAMLFTEGETVYPYPCEYSGDEKGYAVEKVAETVFNDMQKESLDEDGIIEELSCGWLDGAPDYKKFKKPGKRYEIDWNTYHKANKEYAQKLTKEFIGQNPDATFFGFDYSDNDGAYGCALEHGDLFRRLNYIQVSHH